MSIEYDAATQRVLLALRRLDANAPSDALRPLTARYSMNRLRSDLRDVEDEIHEADGAAIEAGAAIVKARAALTRAVGRLVVAEEGMPSLDRHPEPGSNDAPSTGANPALIRTQHTTDGGSA